MSVFAGIVKLNNERVLQKDYQIFKDCFESITKKPISKEYRDNNQFFFAVNLVKEENYIFDEQGRYTFISGKPLIAKSGNLKEDITLINGMKSNQELKCILRKSRGVFSGVTIETTQRETFIYTDKMGIRPVYYYQFDGMLVFSSLLSFIQCLPKVDMTIDTGGISELIAFGYCLSDRTQYQHVKRMNAGEMITVSLNDYLVENRKYWDFSNIPIREKEKNDAKDLYNIFQDAIEVRLEPDKDAIAFLSGGLDSRTITALLNSQVENLFTFNFGTKKSQDNEYARKYAEISGLCHYEVLLPKLSFPNWSQLISDAIENSDDKTMCNTDKNVVWSGDGGSVSIGGVYLDEENLSLFENRKNKNIVENFLETLKISLPSNFFRKEIKDNFSELLNRNVANELIDFPQDKAKTVYHFLMCNDQKRHLDRHFETICQHEIELKLPFFDSIFIEKLYSLPVRELKNHRLYMEWFKCFPESSRLTPWQTYPNHIPCPIKNDSKLSYQWSKSKLKKESLKTDFKRFICLRGSNAFNYLDKKKVLLAMLLHRMGVKDYSYLITTMNRLNNKK